MTKPFQTRPTTRPMKAEAVRFHNGMIVTDTDLNASMRYAVQLLAATNRAVHGCGVACGFEFSPDPDLCGTTTPCEPCPPDSDRKPRMAYPGFNIRVGRGSAFDCYGMPIELCEPVLVELPSGTACGCGDGKDGGAEVCIAIRRVSSEEAPRGDCCGDGSEPQACTRIRDHVELRAFRSDELPKHICRGRDPSDGGCGCGCSGSDNGKGDAEGANRSRRCGPGWGGGQAGRDQRRICDCLTRCAPCECCGDGWVLLGCVELCETGIPVDLFAPENCHRLYAGRPWIRTVECFCGMPFGGDDSADEKHETREDLIEPEKVEILREELRASEVRFQQPELDQVLYLYATEGDAFLNRAAEGGDYLTKAMRFQNAEKVRVLSRIARKMAAGRGES
ncbi:hypothetical protein HKCCE3408_14635 [Rhodobacterales bacterium HKCCE3408]|nr:hypothetical protein [Rhodobacterales bacterium HKCCE3408]